MLEPKFGVNQLFVRIETEEIGVVIAKNWIDKKKEWLYDLQYLKRDTDQFKRYYESRLVKEFKYVGDKL